MDDEFKLRNNRTFRIAIERAATKIGRLTQGNDDDQDIAKIALKCIEEELGL